MIIIHFTSKSELENNRQQLFTFEWIQFVISLQQYILRI